MTDPKESARRDDAVTAGRGFLFITGAKIWFLVTSTVINIGLPRLLDDPARFGDFKVVNTLISIINMVMITGTIQAVAKMVSENEASARSVQSRAFRLQAFVGGGLFLLLFLLADPICGVLLQDASLATYLRIASVIVLAYAFYAIYVGMLNGLKMFRGQAALDITFSTMKTGLIIALVLLGYSVAGAFVGFAAAAVAIIFVAAFLTRGAARGGTPAKVDAGRLSGFMFQIMAYTFVVNMLLQVDVLIIKGLKLEPFRDALLSETGLTRMSLLGAALPSYAGVAADPLSTALATEATSRLAGFFGAMKNVSMIPYQAIISITFVIFPLISQSTFSKDMETTRRYVRQTFRSSLILVAAPCIILLTSSEPLVALLFGKPYTVGADALVLLLAATVCFALLFVGNTIITGAGHAKTALGIGLVTLLANVGAVVGLLLQSGPWKSALDAAAWGGVISLVLGLVLCLGVIYLRFKSTLPPLTLLRVIGLGAALTFGSSLLPHGGPVLLIVRMAVVGVLFLVGLVLTGEFTREDLAAVKRIVRRKAA
jgi:stage V sporulation protein B